MITIPESRWPGRLLGIYEKTLRITARKGLVAGQHYQQKAFAAIPGVRILDARIGHDDAAGHYRCGNYAFGVRHRQKWALPGIPHSDRLLDRTCPFLKDRGYELVETPRENDVTAYLGKRVTTHFGIVHDPQTLVIDSKFGVGPILRHPFHVVFHSYGTRAEFWRRNG